MWRVTVPERAFITVIMGLTAVLNGERDGYTLSATPYPDGFHILHLNISYRKVHTCSQICKLEIKGSYRKTLTCMSLGVSNQWSPPDITLIYVGKVKKELCSCFVESLLCFCPISFWFRTLKIWHTGSYSINQNTLKNVFLKWGYFFSPLG